MGSRAVPPEEHPLQRLGARNREPPARYQSIAFDSAIYRPGATSLVGRLAAVVQKTSTGLALCRSVRLHRAALPHRIATSIIIQRPDEPRSYREIVPANAAQRKVFDEGLAGGSCRYVRGEMHVMDYLRPMRSFKALRTLKAGKLSRMPRQSGRDWRKTPSPLKPAAILA